MSRIQCFDFRSSILLIILRDEITIITRIRASKMIQINSIRSPSVRDFTQCDAWVYHITEKVEKPKKGQPTCVTNLRYLYRVWKELQKIVRKPQVSWTMWNLWSKECRNIYSLTSNNWNNTFNNPVFSDQIRDDDKLAISSFPRRWLLGDKTIIQVLIQWVGNRNNY